LPKTHERLATDISKTAALDALEEGWNHSGKESVSPPLNNRALIRAEVPEIDLEGFGLGL
jgi:hypothetical protein